MKACVQWARKDGFYPVFIRVNHKRSTLYIKTDKMVTKRELSPSKDINDPVVMNFCTSLILEYMHRLNRVDIRNWTCVVHFDLAVESEKEAGANIKIACGNLSERTANRINFDISMTLPHPKD